MLVFAFPSAPPRTLRSSNNLYDGINGLWPAVDTVGPLLPLDENEFTCCAGVAEFKGDCDVVMLALRVDDIPLAAGT